MAAKKSAGAGKAPKAAKVAESTREAKARKATGPESAKPAAGPAGAETPARFPIVGLGASAGGLEAFEEFFRHVPRDSGLAFVLVPHLDPGHASILTDILQRTTAMHVIEARDQMRVEPNGVYVIPPNRDMAIFNGVLQLSMPEQPRGQRMPIDAFLRSLAEDQGEKAVGVVLSGTGTDGTLGLRAILGAGGVTLVQQPETAKYSGMPASAIEAGYATEILPVDKMPEALLSGLRILAPEPGPPPSPSSVSGMNRVLMTLRSVTGHDFSLYKKSTIGRRIQRRMAQHVIADTETYARYLKEHPAEVQSLFKELLINVTSFFRDPDAFAALKQEILPLLFDGKPDDYVARIWVPGCATGEEAYSIAMLLREYMDETRRDFRVQLYSTDLDEEAIAVARAGLYPPNIVQDVTPERLRRFFVKEDAGYRVKKEIREMVVFAVQNVIKDPPFTKLDLLSCRNLMIYLEPELQSRIIPAFHYALKPGGILFLSPSESIGNHPDLFSAVNRKWKFYRATHTVASTRTVMASGLTWAADGPGKASEEVAKKGRGNNLAELTRRVLLQSYAPVSVVTDIKGNILYVYGDTGKYLRPAPGQATLSIVEMARPGLQMELRAAILSAGQGTAVLDRELTVAADGEGEHVAMSVRPLVDSDGGQPLLLVNFQDGGRGLAGKGAGATGRARRRGASVQSQRVADLEQDLAYTKENLQATIEEQQASNEELKSANEELQSTNEELQSANEELETSKEELQSVNEELVTVNSELQAKIEELAGMQNDMKNLLDNMSVGAIFLDRHLLIRRFTREAARVYRLVSSDVGRPLADIKSDLGDEDLLPEAQAVLDSLVPYEREVGTTGGAWYLARIQPYRTLENVIEGVVLTFTDISQRVAAEAALREALELAASITATVREPLLVLDAQLVVVSASSAFYRQFQASASDTVGRPLFDIGDGQWNTPAVRELLEEVLPRDQFVADFCVDYALRGLSPRRVQVNARRIVGATSGKPLVLLAMEESEADVEPSP